MLRRFAVVGVCLILVTAFAPAALASPAPRASRDHASDGAVPGERVPTAPQTNPAWLEGVDISNWQGSIDWSQVASSGERFAIMKATEGVTYVDPTYAHNRQAALAAGMVVTAYHFARPDLHPTEAGAASEADHFVDVAGIGAGDIIPALDLERDGGLSQARLIAWAESWLQEVKARTGITPMIYSGPARWQDKMGNTQQFADEGYRLWLAHWTTGTPTVPANDWGGHGWTFWQYTDCGKVPGIAGCVDLDHYNSTNLAPVRIPTLTVTTNGVGTVTSSPAAIDCGSQCAAAVDPGATYTLTATPSPGAVLVAWERACTGAGSCSVKVVGNKRVDAVFGYSLTLSLGGTAGGTVTSSPAGLSCGSGAGTCVANFAASSPVTLTAQPDPGSQFQGWSGDCAGQALTCTVTMDAARSVTASFTDDTPPTATLSSPASLNAGPVATFDEPVRAVSPEDFVLEVLGSGTAVPSSVTCSGHAGAPADCATGDVTRAVLSPQAGLMPGQSYEAIVNPPGAPSQVVDRSGNPAAETTSSFRAATSVEESDLGSAWRWRAVRDGRASGGSYSIDDVRGASASLAFSGPSVRWDTVAGPDEGIARVVIDGKTRGVYDLSAGATRFVHRRFGSLGAGEHTIRLVALGRRGAHGPGRAVAVDGFVVNGTAVPADSISYAWASSRSSPASGGAVAIGDERGAALVLRFRGTSIRWLTARGPGEGRAQVLLDGRKVGTFDGYATQTQYGVSRTFGGLSDAVHTVKIVVLGTSRRAASGTAVVVDGFRIG